METADEKGDLIAYGRWFISNVGFFALIEDNLLITLY